MDANLSRRLKSIVFDPAFYQPLRMRGIVRERNWIDGVADCRKKIGQIFYRRPTGGVREDSADLAQNSVDKYRRGFLTRRS